MKVLHQKRWAGVVLLLTCLGMLGLSGCKDHFSDVDIEDDEIIGLFALRGQEIVTNYSDWPIPENDVPSVDTTRINFLMLIRSVDGEKNRVRMYGLEGADVGKREHYLYPGCKTPDDCKIIGMLEGEDLEIDINNNGRSYLANIMIRNNYVEITATYNHQQTTIHYEVDGGVMIE
tara:strand:+ start:9134 stop:9658 length:525 start_codon:yes stop_codon:yes gene_type:complete